MMKKLILIFTITAILVLAAASGCELFENPPRRDNINDANCEWGIDVTYTKTFNSITVNWLVDDTNSSDKVSNKAIVYWGTGEIGDASTEQYDAGNSGVCTIEGLEYGTDYNIWIEVISTEDGSVYSAGEVIFTWRGVEMPESSGVLDSDFASGSGLFAYPVDPAIGRDIVSLDNNYMYVGGGCNGDTTYVFLKITPEGTLDISYNATGIYNPGAGTIFPLSVTTMNDDFYAFLRYDIGLLPYYKNTNGSTNTGLNFEGIDCLGMDDNHMIVSGMNGAENFSVFKYDSTVYVTNSSEFQLQSSDFTIDGSVATVGKATDIAYNEYDGNLYVSGYIRNAVFNNQPVIVVLDYDNLNNASQVILNDSWEWDQERVRDITTDGLDNPMTTPVIAAGPDGSVWVAATGILGKVRENGNVYDLDDSVGNNGTITLPDNTYPVDIIVQENDKVLVFIVEVDDLDAAMSEQLRTSIYKYNPDGTLDTSFGANGVKSLDDDRIIKSAAITPKGKIIATGFNDITNRMIVMQLE